jgi:hypothetical protein
MCRFAVSAVTVATGPVTYLLWQMVMASAQQGETSSCVHHYCPLSLWQRKSCVYVHFVSAIYIMSSIHQSCTTSWKMSQHLTLYYSVSLHWNIVKPIRWFPFIYNIIPWSLKFHSVICKGIICKAHWYYCISLHAIKIKILNSCIHYFILYGQWLGVMIWSYSFFNTIEVNIVSITFLR